ncbi:MAG TPA: phosphomannomutase [Nevskiaceae bacterium]|nr:phosphomannomutase [Nevskiaceae bacterium]
MPAASRLPAFKAYDIRGRVPEELDRDLVYRLGQAYAERFQPQQVALGRDVRHSSAPLLDALAHGLHSRGVRALDLGLCGTEEVYWAAQQPGVDGGIMVTASHNPQGYNGLKLVRGGAIPVSGDSGLRELEAAVAASSARCPPHPAAVETASFRARYVDFLRRQIAPGSRPLRIVVNAGNGAAAPLLDALEPHLPHRLIKIHHTPDGDFPHGIPNPLLPEMRADTIRAVREHGADLGVAWDGDFDRCFLFDERGEFVEGYYIVGLLAEALLAGEPGGRIIHDPRLTWNTIDQVQAAGGIAIQSKTGHAFIKERMRAENALYGGEMSAHHYFRDFAYCDSGMIPWLLVAGLVGRRGQPLSQLLAARIAAFPASGEINREVREVGATLAAVAAQWGPQAVEVDRTDGLSCTFAEGWRFNLRGSNTEPVLRLNVESRGDAGQMRRQTAALLAFIDTVAR